jgi:hypothetical protein
MKYQLVLQWSPTSSSGYDELIATEDRLIENLSDKNEVDGHDMGSGVMNIFIRTNNPEGAFSEIRNILAQDFRSNNRVAYREILGEEYKILWPPGLREFRVK